MERREYRAIDCDGHVLEPPGMWERYIDTEYKPQAPTIIQDGAGIEWLLVEGRLMPKASGRARGKTDGLNLSPTQGYTARPAGAFDPKRRLQDLDALGIEAAVLLPTQGLGIGGVRDPKLAAALCKAYNTWAAEYCSVVPERLIGVAVVPLQDVDASIRELERAVKEYGFKAVSVRPNPYWVREGTRTLDNPALDPFYAAVADLGVPLMIHEGTGVNMPTAGADRFDIFFFTHMVAHPFEQMLASLSLIGGGALERHPNLRPVFLESGCSWLHYWLWRMDEHHEKRGQEVPWLRQKPSDYFRRQCAISCDPDEPNIATTVEYVGAECFVFATDYAHWDGVADPVAEFLEHSTLPDSVNRLILRENAGRLLRLPSVVGSGV